MRSDSTIEKSFLYLLLLSLLVHIGLLTLAYYLPEPQQQHSEPVFIDLQQMPELKTAKPVDRPNISHPADRQVQRRTAPKPSDTAIRANRAKAAAQKSNEIAPGASLQSLLKPKAQIAKEQKRPQLLPDASIMAQREEAYRRKFEKDIAEGKTGFLNNNDVRFGSFLHHLENAIYGEWVYPPDAARKGIEGITSVIITFNRKGAVVRVKLVEGSGSAILDNEVFRTLHTIGPIGSLPRGFDKDEYNLIASFQYGGPSRRSLR